MSLETAQMEDAVAVATHKLLLLLLRPLFETVDGAAGACRTCLICIVLFRAF